MIKSLSALFLFAVVVVGADACLAAPAGLYEVRAFKVGLIPQARRATPGGLFRQDMWAMGSVEWQVKLAERTKGMLEADIDNIIRLAPGDRALLMDVLCDLEAASPYLDFSFLQRMSNKIIAVANDREVLAICNYISGKSMMNAEARMEDSLMFNNMASMVYDAMEGTITQGAANRLSMAFKTVPDESKFAPKIASALVLCMLNSGDLEGATHLMDKAEKRLASNPDAGWIFLSWVQIHRDCGEKKKAVGLCEAIIARWGGATSLGVAAKERLAGLRR